MKGKDEISQMENKYESYCTGCGLCKSLNKAALKVDQKGFNHPENYDTAFLSTVCPVSGIQSKRFTEQSIWGRSQAVYYGWSNDPKIRERASSGGVLTTLAIYLLQEKVVDGIVHVHRDVKCAYRNNTVISTTEQEILQGTGSRYSISHPLDIIATLDKKKTYCLIAKPCDITVIRNYAQSNPEVNSYIKICLSFFCMGLPSDDAQKMLLKKLDCSNDCASLDYRGNGWPGYATAVDNNGHMHRITYDESWGKILGRDLMPYCRYCIDGVGEEADISCGDAWYVKCNKPDFEEHDGRNVIFARSELGNEILQRAYQANVLHIEQFLNYEEYLPVIQNSQYMRRATLFPRILALQIMRKVHPEYNKSVLKFYSGHVKWKTKLKVFIGMIHRIQQGKY